MRHAIAAILALLLCATSATAQDDSRTLVSLDPSVRDQLLAEMRGHMESLDDIIAAVGTGDFAAAAEIADIRLDFGHRMWEAMAAQGASPAQIAQVKERWRGLGTGPGAGATISQEQRQAMHERMQQQMPDGKGLGPGKGMGVGRFMPEDFRQMGFAMHEAGGELAKTLRAVAKPANAEDYRQIMAKLSDVTTVCRSCHASFRVR